jgi:hypothetical protein
MNPIWRWPRALVLVWVVALWCVGAQAQERPAHELNYTSASFFRYNALGLSSRGWLGLRSNLYRAEAGEAQHILLSDCHWSVGVAPEVTPAIGRGGLQVDWKPLAILELSGLYERVGYFGTFNHLQYFPSARSSHSDDDLEGRAGSVRVSGHNQLTVSGRLQAKVGPVAVRSKWSGILIHAAELRGEERTFYDPTLDALAVVDGWTLWVDNDLLYLAGGGLTVGVRHSWQEPLFSDDQLAGGDGADVDLTQHRVGPLVAWRFHEAPGDVFSGRTAFLLVQWWLQHPYRAGQESAQALPMVVVGYAFEGSLARW